MPVYEYVCQTCGNDVEVLHGLYESGPGACDVCGGPMRKRLAPPTIVFRGSGWAKKERRDAASAKAGDASKRDASKEKEGAAAAKGDASGDTAPVDRSGQPKSGSGDASKSGSGDASKPAGAKKEATAG